MTDRQFMLLRTGGGEPPHPARRRGRMRRRPSARGQLAGIGLQGARSDRHSGRMKTLPFGGGREITMSIERPQGLIAGAGLFAACVRPRAAATDRQHACAVCPLGRLATRIGRRLQMSAAWSWARAWPCSRSAPTGPSLVVCVLPAVALALDAPAWLLAALRAQSSRTPRLPVRPDVRPAWIRQPATGASVPVRVLDVCPR